MYKLYIALLIILLILPASVSAEKTSEKKEATPPPTAWEPLAPLGLREACGIDTLEYNYYQTAIPSARSSAWATTGDRKSVV